MTWQIGLTIINVLAIGVILQSGIQFKRGSRSRVANALLVMFICIAAEIAGVTGALFIPEWLEMPIRFFMRCVELAGVVYFGWRLSSLNGKAHSQ